MDGRDVEPDHRVLGRVSRLHELLRHAGRAVMIDQRLLHNTLLPPIVNAMTVRVVDSGGDVADVLTLAESVLLGVSLACVGLGGDPGAIDAMLQRVKDRRTALQLTVMPVKGKA